MERKYICQANIGDYLTIMDTATGVDVTIKDWETSNTVALSPTQVRDLADQLRAIADKAEPNRKPDITGDSFL